MARIRSIKPEFWTSAQVLECSPIARLLFIGLWNFCDDAGRHVDSLKQIKAEIFPADEILLDDIRGMIDELEQNGLVKRYVAEGQALLQVTGWHNQRIDKPQPSRYPGPDEDHSENVPGTVQERSRLIGEDRKGKDRTGREGTRARATPARSARAPDPPEGLDADAWERFERYRREIKKTLKPASIEAAQRKLASFGEDQAAVVEQSIANGWQGLFPLKDTNRTPNGVARGPDEPPDKLQREAEARGENIWALPGDPDYNPDAAIDPVAARQAHEEALKRRLQA